MSRENSPCQPKAWKGSKLPRARSVLSTASKGVCCIAATTSTSWPITRRSRKVSTCSGTVSCLAAGRSTRQVATIVAAFERCRAGAAPVDPDPSLGHAANFLYMLTGRRPSDLETRSMDLILLLHADHDFNASTFTARGICSPLADMHSAVTGAIGSLKGPLH